MSTDETQGRAGDPPAQGDSPTGNADAGTPAQPEVNAAAQDISEPNTGEKTNPDTPAFEAPRNDDLGQDEVQERMNAQLEQGFMGAQVDPTPNENYSLQTPQDAPTPETDPNLAAAARDAAFGNRLSNIEVASNVTAPHNQTEGDEAA